MSWDCGKGADLEIWFYGASLGDNGAILNSDSSVQSVVIVPASYGVVRQECEGVVDFTLYAGSSANIGVSRVIPPFTYFYQDFLFGLAGLLAGALFASVVSRAWRGKGG